MHFLIYILAYIVIGVVTGFISHRWMPGVVPRGHIGMMIATVLASLANGVSVYYFAATEWTTAQWRGTGVYTGADGTSLPGYWLSLFAAMGGALLMAAIYKLILSRHEGEPSV